MFTKSEQQKKMLNVTTDFVNNLVLIKKEMDSIYLKVTHLRQSLIIEKRRVLLEEARKASGKPGCFSWCLQQFFINESNYPNELAVADKVYQYSVDALDDACMAIPDHPRNNDFYVIVLRILKPHPNINYFKIRYGSFSALRDDIPCLMPPDVDNCKEGSDVYTEIYKAFKKSLEFDVTDTCYDINFIYLETESDT